MALFIPRSYLRHLWPWTANVERILRFVQPRPFKGSHLAFGSDYSGDHRTSRFRVYCFLIVDTNASPDWPRQRRKVRQHFLPDGRRMSFKTLGDRLRQRALTPFLEAAETIEGHLVGVIVTKSINNISMRAGWTDDLPSTLGLQGS